jgi:DNA-binding transcriptional MerR regulator
VSSEPLLTISAFARAVDLAPSALRYYDEAGLLPPAEVDPRTGYRYYTPELERRALLIRRMRDVGVPVETMRLVLAGPPERAAEILAGFAERAAHSARQASATVEEIVAVLSGERNVQPVAVTVDGPGLAAALRRVARAASVVEDPLRGVLLDLGPDGITAVATDRYWLAYWTIPVAEAQVPERRAFVPSDLLLELADHLARRDVVTISFEAGRIDVCDESGAVSFATVDDRFPAYRLIIPVERVGRVTFERAALARVLPKEDTPLRLVVGADRLAVNAIGHSEGFRVDARAPGQPATLWLTSGLLRSALDTMVGDAVSLLYAAPDRAVQLVPVEQNRLAVLLMPGRPQS